MPRQVRRKRKKKEEEEVLKPAPVVEPAPALTPTPAPQAAGEKGGLFVDPRTGRPSGIELPSGRTFLGLTPDEIEDIKRREGLPEDLPLIGEKLRKEREAETFLKERGLLEKEAPVRAELDIAPGETPLEKLPILGGTIAATVGLMQPDIRPLIQNPATIREVALQEIQRETIAEGTTVGEEFGAVIESIPLVGTLVNKYASGLVEAPSSNVATILAQLDSTRERASVIAEKVEMGKLNRFTASDELLVMEENIIRLETRIQVLSQGSAILRADPDEVNRIEERILRTKERIFIAQQAAAAGIVQEPSDESIYLELKRLKEKNR